MTMVDAYVQALHDSFVAHSENSASLEVAEATLRRARELTDRDA